MTLRAMSTTAIGTRRDGRPRVWLEGIRLGRSGFTPAARYDLDVDLDGKRIVLTLADAGGRMVSRRATGGAPTPIVEIASAKALSMFDGLERLDVRFEQGRILITPSASDVRRIERAARLREGLESGRPLQVGSVSTGLGVLALAMHEGLAAAGVETRLAFSVEIDQAYQDHSMAANPVWDAETLAISAPLQEVAFDAALLASLPRVDVLEAGIPCTAHSLAGRAKKGLSMPEDDPAAGHLVAGFLAIVAACNPAVLVVENVPLYLHSASFAILSNQLAEWGYDVRSTVLSGADFGCLETRDRMALVATTQGVDVHIDTLTPIDAAPTRLGDVLDDLADDDPRWSNMECLRAKEERDIAAGKGFRMQTFDVDDSAVSTIGRGYSKVRSTEPKIRHPNDPRLLRQLTPAEHARIKGVSPAMIQGLGVTFAHQMLGQSVLATPFRALAERIGGAMRAWQHDRPAPRGVARMRAIAPVSELPLFAAA